MSGVPSIHYVRQQDIEKQKWDARICSASNSLIYACSAYLDAMAKNWDALVIEDYQAVMPLTWNRKYGMDYLYQPAFTASLGIFGDLLSPALVDTFIQAIPPRFRLVEIAMNHGNMPGPTHIGTTVRQNYVLPLGRPYEELAAGYRQHIRRNIKKAKSLGCSVQKSIPLSEVIRLSRPVMQHQARTTQEDYGRFEKLYQLLQHQDQACTYGAYSPHQELVASAVFLFDKRRAYYILVGNHPFGKDLSASHLLIDGFIRDQADQELTLDFEGSDLESLAFFYSSFGAHPEPHPFLKIDRLPVWARWARQFRRHPAQL
jgi:hypothetical protein